MLIDFRGWRDGERERGKDLFKRNMDQLPLTYALTRAEPAVKASTLTGNWTHNILVYGMMLPTTEPLWPGIFWDFLKLIY